MPRTVGSGRKPGNRYASSSRRGFRIRASCQLFCLEEKVKTLETKGFRGHHRRFPTHSVGRRACKGIRLAVMDMWKPFRNSTLKAGNAPQAGILYDKFHILKHLNEALDKVRKSEYARLSGTDRRFIKGLKYTLLSRRANLSQEGRQSLKALFKANKRLNKAYLLKEMFSQLWDYQREGWARRFFERWKSALRWQRLKPYEKFARMVEAHWDGIASYCHEENKVPLGFVEGINNKIRVIQRRAYGLRDEEYLRLKILTCMLPEI